MKTLKCNKCGVEYDMHVLNDATIGIDKGLNVDVYHLCPVCTEQILGFLEKEEELK